MNYKPDDCSFCNKPILDNEDFFFSEKFDCTVHVECLVNAIKDKNNKEAHIMYEEFAGWK